MSAEGVADCKVMMDQADLTRCDAKRGWRDPGGQAMLVDRHGTTLRRCEVVQLGGLDLQSCRGQVNCAGCPSGWCVTEVATLLPSSACAAGTHPWPLRFIGGAAVATGGWLNVTCATASTN